MVRVSESRTEYLEHLFAPLKIGSLQLKNRIVMPAMGIRLASHDGLVSDKFMDYYIERAKGGVGLIVVGCCLIRDGLTGGILSISSDEKILGLTELAESIHEWGAKVFVQLYEPGMTPDATGEMVARGVDHLTVEQIETIISSYVAAAERAKKAGFDGVEIHGAHGYFVGQFFSPLTNHRTDEFGGKLANRVAVPAAIVRRIREKTGSDYPISFRLNGDDYMEGGMTLEDAKTIAQLLEKAGVDILSITAGKRPESFEWSVQPMALPRGCLVDLAQAIKKSVSIPVIVAGRINDPVLANQILAEKKADLIAMGRAVLADPDMPQKAMERRYDDIRKCIGCMVCHQRNWGGQRIRCAVNAQLGKEGKSAIVKSDKPKKVLVIGGGPGGLEAARVLALRGHQVTLHEKQRELGGEILLAAKPPHKEEVLELMNYLSRQINLLGVQVRLGKGLKIESIIAARPDAVIVATGGKPVIPNIKGVDRKNVYTAPAVLGGSSKVKVGDRVVVIGGGLVGCEVAEFLAGQGKSVAIVEERKGLVEMGEIHVLSRKLLLERLNACGVKPYTSARVKEIKENTVLVSRGSNNLAKLPADTVVLAVGSEADTSLVNELMKANITAYAIGSATGRFGIMVAIHDGFRIGNLL